MCGILGVVSRNGAPVPTDLVSRLTTLIHHRGPDDRGVARLGRACFGLTRLAIIGVDDAAARQPVQGDDCLLTFNGEIYNFRELAAELSTEGIPLGGASDTEVLCLCLRHWGIERTLDRVDGMFAFAFFDGRDSTLYLARDPMGEKPLYWSATNERLWFGSEMKVLLASGDVSAAPNLARIDDYLFTTKVNGSATIFRDVAELEPGTVLALAANAAEPRVRAYWRLEDALDGPVPELDDAVRDEFASKLAKAVASRRVSDVAVGVLLSGGIDSNSLVELMLSATSDDSLDLFFADNANASASERPDVEIFLDRIRQRFPAADLRLWPSVLPFDDYLEGFRQLTWLYDEPVSARSAPSLYGLCARARDLGIKVLLCGEGLDELLHGYVRFERTLKQLEGVRDRPTILAGLYHGGGLHSVGLVRQLTAGVAEGPEATEPWRWLDEQLDRWPLEHLQLIYRQKYMLLLLLQRQDRVGMGKSVEIRVPYLAPWFVRWVNHLPTATKFDSRTSTTKVILREVMRERLPERILTKPKDGFPTDMQVWLREQTMRRLVSELVGDANGFCQSYLDGALARRLVNDHFDGTSRQDELMWCLLALEVWHRTFANGIRCPDSAEADRLGIGPAAAN